MVLKNDIIAIVLNWNDIVRTKRCLISLQSQNELSCDIVVIDNDSEIDPTESIKKMDPEIHVIRNNSNLGVAGGRNVGIEYALKHHYKYLLLFDNDAYAHPEMLKHLLSVAKKRPNSGIIGPKIYIHGKDAVIWRAGCTSWKWTYLHAGSQIIDRFFNSINVRTPAMMDTKRGEGVPDAGQFQKEQDIDFQIGCAQFIRSVVFRGVGLLDEQFTPYGSEDIDFCARVRKAGWRIVYTPKAICWHEIEDRTAFRYDRAYHNAKNILLLARKHLSNLYFVFFVFDFFLLTTPLLTADSLIRRRKGHIKAIMHAVLWNIEDIRRTSVRVR